MTLEPGDLILTGTPAGVGPLTARRSRRGFHPGLGMLANTVESARIIRNQLQNATGH